MLSRINPTGSLVSLSHLVLHSEGQYRLEWPLTNNIPSYIPGSLQHSPAEEDVVVVNPDLGMVSHGHPVNACAASRLATGIYTHAYCNVPGFDA